MTKEYSEEYKNPETGAIEERKLGPAYFEDSPEFKKELEASLPQVRQAIFDVFINKLYGKETASRPKIKEVAEKIVEVAIKDLSGPERDSTMAIAAVEADIFMLNKAEEKGVLRMEEAGENLAEAVTDLKEIRAERDQLEHLREFLYSINPHLTELATKEDVLSWAEIVRESMVREVDNIAHGPKLDTNTMKAGELANQAESFERFIHGQPTRADYDTILVQLEESRVSARKQMALLIVDYGFLDNKDVVRKRIGKEEELIFQYDQFGRILESERAYMRLPKSIK